MIIRVLNSVRYLLMVAKDQKEYLGEKCWEDPVEVLTGVEVLTV